MNNTIYLLRHGQSIANVDPSIYATTRNEEISLTPAGRSQILQAASFIKQNIVKSQSLALHSSPYVRCETSAKIILETLDTRISIRPNLLLSEVNCGEQEGCNVENFEERPIEAWNHKKVGALRYQPLRGENLLDLHVRAGLFVVQQEFFRYCTTTIIVSHASLCLMMHFFLLNSCPTDKVLEQSALQYWPNALVRKYTSGSLVMPFKYNGILGNGNDMLL